MLRIGDDGASVRVTVQCSDVCESIIEDQMQVRLVFGQGEDLQEILLGEAEGEVEDAVVRQSWRVKHLASNYYIHLLCEHPTKKEKDNKPP